MSDRASSGRPWPALGSGRVLALVVLVVAVAAAFLPPTLTLMGPHFTLILIAGLALAILL